MSELKARPTCSTCACYRPDLTQLLVGVCRCLPPTPLFVNQNGAAALISVSPPVPASGYCHQWRPLAESAPGTPAANSPGIPPSWESFHDPQKDHR